MTRPDRRRDTLDRLYEKHRETVDALLAEHRDESDDLTDLDGPPLEDYSTWTQVYPLEHDPALMAQAWHDVTCPEGPDCRGRLLHSMGQTLATSGVLARFCERYDEVRQDKQWKALR